MAGMSRQGMFSMAPHRRGGRALWSAVVFMCVAAGMVLAVCVLYLKPAMNAWKTADAPGRRMLSGVALLMLGVLFSCLIILLILSMRIARSSASRRVGRLPATKYTDAWAESAKRMPTPPAIEEEEDGPV